MSVTAVVHLDQGKARKQLGGLAKGLRQAMKVAMRARVNARISHVVKNKLTGQVLRVQTGTLRRNVANTANVVQAGDHLIGAFGTDLRYGIAHELGFVGAVTVKAHERERRMTRSQRRKAAALFGANAEDLRATAHVRAHQRQVNIRARHYLADTQREMTPGDEPVFLKALRFLATTGKPPTLADLRG